MTDDSQLEDPADGQAFKDFDLSQLPQLFTKESLGRMTIRELLAIEEHLDELTLDQRESYKSAMSELMEPLGRAMKGIARQIKPVQIGPWLTMSDIIGSAARSYFPPSVSSPFANDTMAGFARSAMANIIETQTLAITLAARNASLFSAVRRQQLMFARSIGPRVNTSSLLAPETRVAFANLSKHMQFEVTPPTAHILGQVRAWVDDGSLSSDELDDTDAQARESAELNAAIDEAAEGLIQASTWGLNRLTARRLVVAWVYINMVLFVFAAMSVNPTFGALLAALGLRAREEIVSSRYGVSRGKSV